MLLSSPIFIFLILLLTASDSFAIPPSAPQWIYTASKITIVDSAGFYDATNVEDALEEVMDKVTPVTYSAATITAVTGTVDAGNVTSVQTIDDADTYQVSEVTGAPGFDIQITFSGITSGHEPNKIQGHYSYNGSHTINIEMWNYTGTPAWDVIDNTTIVNTGGVLTWFSIDITGNITDYVSGGSAKLRFNHSGAGNITHDFIIDLANIKDDSSGGGGVTEHGALSGLSDNDHLQYLKDGTLTDGEICQYISATDDVDCNINTEAELETALDATNLIVSTEIDSLGEIETLTGVSNILIENDIDASSELAAIMDDETGSGALMFGTLPAATWDAVVKTGDASLTAAEVSSTIVYVTATATITLPTAVEGYTTCIYSTTAAAIYIELDNGDNFVLTTDGASTGLDNGDQLDSDSAAGSFICLHAKDADEWFTLGWNGTWSDGGP